VSRNHLKVLIILLISYSFIAACSDSSTSNFDNTLGDSNPPKGSGDTHETFQSSTAEPPQGPHGQYDPHKKLDADSLIRVGLQHYEEGRPGLAIQTLNDAINRYGDNASLHAVRGSIYLQQGEYTRALADFEAGVTLAPDNAELLVNRAQSYRQFGRVEQAMADLNKAIELEPDLIAARFNRGAMLYSLSDFSGAYKDFDHCIAVDPHNAAPYFNRASAQEAMGNYSKAIADMQRFIELTDDEEWKQSAQELLESWQGKTDIVNNPDAKTDTEQKDQS